MFTLAKAQVCQGCKVSLPGHYVLEEDVDVSIPAFPTTETWSHWAGDRPVVLEVSASNVVLDLGFRRLQLASEEAYGAVLVYVSPGCSNVRICNGLLGLSALGVFLDLSCKNTELHGLTIINFLEKGVLAYSPLGMTITDTVIGPNMLHLQDSQETQTLRAYDQLLNSSNANIWQQYHDDLKFFEASHVTAVAVVPGIDAEAPFPVQQDTGYGISLERVHVNKLTMAYREHSFLVAQSLSQGRRLTKKALGSFGEPLGEWYRSRIEAAKRLGRSYFYPSTARCSSRSAFTTDVGGTSQNTSSSGGSDLTLTQTYRVVGVDRAGNALRGVQSLLFVGCGTPSFSTVSVDAPEIMRLSPRLFSNQNFPCPSVDLTVFTGAESTVVLPGAKQTTDAARANLTQPWIRSWYPSPGSGVRMNSALGGAHVLSRSGSLIVR